MLGAIYIGLSGMDTYSKGLQTISNNVANLNSNGFKQTTLAFADLSDGGRSRPSFLGGNFGSGGSGVHIGSSLIDFSQGELRQTANDLDLGIQGTGFLVVLDKDGKTFYTRTGSFGVDKDGFISDQATGDRLAVLDATGHPVALNVGAKETNDPVATTKVAFADNLSSSDNSGVPIDVSGVTVYDSRGGKHVWDVKFSKSADAGLTDVWDVKVTDESGNPVGTTGTLKFNGNNVDLSTATMTVPFAPDGADAMVVTLDFSKVVSQSGGTSSTIHASDIDGNPVGTLSSTTVDENGAILLTYSNGKTASPGSVAMADFRDLQQLTPVGDGLYKNAGNEIPRYLASATEGIGTLTPKRIEASNVDLSSEFGDLILVQRGFQACSQVVSVSNDMIQQLFAIRGQ